MASSSRPKVVVVGAGMAGLSAAAQLADSGLFDITVLEAQDRPGGRIHSTWEFGNTVLELGANWIHGTEGNPVYELAVKHDLLSEDSSMASSSGSSSESSSEDCSWMGCRGEDQDIFFLEDGTQVDRQIAKDAMCFYTSLHEESQHLGEDGVDLAKFADENAGDYLERMAEQKLGQLGLDESVARLYRLIFNWCMRQECVDNGCQSMKDVALLRFNDYKALPGDYYCTLGFKGYQGVLDVLLKRISADQVKCNSAVTKIEWNWMREEEALNNDRNCAESPNNDQTEAEASRKNLKICKAAAKALRTHQALVKCENGDEYPADHVIVTASVGYLKQNQSHLFFPALPDDKQRTLGLLQFGTIDKIFLRYKKPFWKKMFKKMELDGIQLLWNKDYANADRNLTEEATSEEEIERNFMKKVVGFDTVEKHSNMLVGWISGKEAEFMETLDDTKIGEICTKVLRQFLDNPRVPEPVEVVCTRWHSNPYICGAYGSFFPPGATGEEYDNMMAPVYGPNDEEETKNNECPLLLFAGEAYHREYHSTTHGAMVTGYTQADRLTALYKH